MFKQIKDKRQITLGLVWGWFGIGSEQIGLVGKDWFGLVRIDWFGVGSDGTSIFPYIGFYFIQDYNSSMGFT